MVMRSAPYGSTNAKDALDVALTLAAFEQSPCLLYQGAGLQQLLLDTSHTTPFKHIGKMLKALPMYDIPHIYIDQASMASQKIAPEQLDNLPVKCHIVDSEQVAKLLHNHQHIMVF
jgi:tRNA 2-thiouridine synthesizing protein C